MSPEKLLNIETGWKTPVRMYTPLSDGRCNVQQKAAKNGKSKCPIDDVRDGKCPVHKQQIWDGKCPILVRIGMKRMPHRRKY